MMRNKLGIQNALSTDEPIIRELLSWMQDKQADYTNTFLYISGQKNIPGSHVYDDDRFIAWYDIWKQRVDNIETAQSSMNQYNPVYIPRNHLVEEVLDEAISGNHENFHTFLELLKNPYTPQKNSEKYREHDADFEKNYMTFCGT